MGFAPAQVRAMTFWEFAHAAAGIAAFHGAGVAEASTPDEIAAVDALMASASATVS